MGNTPTPTPTTNRYSPVGNAQAASAYEAHREQQLKDQALLNAPIRYNQIADEAIKKHPELAPALRDIASEYSKELPLEMKEIDEVRAATKFGVHQSIESATERDVMAKHQEAIRQRIYAKYGSANGDAALQAFGSAGQPPGIIESVVKNVYDSDKGGFQFGGIIGGLLAGAAAYKMTGGFSGGWMGIIGSVLLVGVGAWGGSKLSDLIFPPKTPEPGPTIQPQTQAGQSQQKDVAPQTMPQVQGLDPNIKPAPHINDPQAPVSPSTLPSGTQPAPQKNPEKPMTSGSVNL